VGDEKNEKSIRIRILEAYPYPSLCQFNVVRIRILEAHPHPSLCQFNVVRCRILIKTKFQKQVLIGPET
jgi:hypothetical protein